MTLMQKKDTFPLYPDPQQKKSLFCALAEIMAGQMDDD